MTSKSFFYCSQGYLEEDMAMDFELFSRAVQKRNSEIKVWTEDFSRDIYGARRGYSLFQTRESPDLEDRLVEILKQCSIFSNSKIKNQKPGLCLTHDIDYLKPTWQLALKRAVGYRKKTRMGSSYLKSFARLLELDQSVQSIGRPVATVFFALPVKSKKLRNRLFQKVLDPSYLPHTDLFFEFVKLAKSFSCQLGVHGSFFSIQENLLGSEINEISKSTRSPIVVGRQHWLNLSGDTPFEVIKNSGLCVDSSLGWNGRSGFRGGMARPFCIDLKDNQKIWEVPLVLMDGPLFDDMKLNSRQVFERAQLQLQQVFDRRGTVAINWHDRAAHTDYGWDEAYARILEWAAKIGFEFRSLTEAVGLSVESHNGV